MAILKNLIVNGASRFLQKAYFDDIEVSGTTTISNLSATTLTVSGQTTLNGAADIKNTFNIKNTDHAVNFYFLPTGSTSTSRIYETNPSTGVYWLNVKNNFNVENNLSASNLIVSNKSNFGGKVKIDGDVDIIGNLRWSTIAEHMTIQNLGGTLLVAPTIYQTNNTTINVTAKTNNSVTFTITDSSMITGTNIDSTNNTFVSGGANWRKNSLVKVSGKIGECVIGASDGTITNINVTNYQMTITATIANAADIEVRSYSASEISDFAVMLYKLHNGTTLFPIGIVLTSYGSDRKSYIDVYGGTDVNPIARMGNLGGLKYNDYATPSGTAGVDELANQWGFFTKGNAYFEGHIKTNAGIIGGWEITSEGLSKGESLGDTNSIFLLPTGKTTTNSIGGSAANLSWTITSNNTFGVTTGGAMYCTSGKIGGWTINGSYLGYGTIGTSNSSVFLSPTGISSSNSIGGSTGTNTWCLTTSNTFGVTTGGALYSTSGKIGGWNITSTELSSGTFASSNADSVFLIPSGSTTTANIGGYGSNVGGWVITSRNTFGVNKNGGMYCTYGKIGGWVIDTNRLYNSGAVLGTSGIFLYPNGTSINNNIGGSGSGYKTWVIITGSNFGVTSDGVLYATGANISGTITATDGNIGGWNISSGQLSYVVNSTDTIGASGSAFLIPGGKTTTNSIGGSNNTALKWTFTSGNNFGVTNTGAMYCTSGKIGGMTIDSGGIFTGNPRDATNGVNDTGVYLGSTGISRKIGNTVSNGLRLAIGENFGVNGSGYSWMRNVYAEKITAFKALRIRGVPELGEKTPEENNGVGISGITFDCIRANASQLSTDSNITRKTLSIGTTFYDSSEDTEYGGYNNILPDCGIYIDRHVQMVDSNYKINTSVTINAESIVFQGRRLSDTYTVGDTSLTVYGSIYSMGSIKYSDVNTGSFTAIGEMQMSKDVSYGLTEGHLYLLITWHNTSYANKGAWLFRGGSSDYIKVNTYHNNTANVTGANVTITLTTTTVKFTSSATIIGRLIDLG